MSASRHLTIPVRTARWPLVATLSLIAGGWLVARSPAGALSDGALDPAFANGAGARTVSLGILGLPFDEGYATAVQADGKMVVVGRSFSALSIVGSIARLRADGSLDPTFGIAGADYLQLGSSTTPTAVLIQPDGRLVVGGDYVDNFGNDRLFVARLLTDGTLDLSFNLTGWVGFDFHFTNSPDYHERLHALAFAPGGQIVLAGSVKPAANRDIAVARLNSDGSVDLPFGGGGCGCFTYGFDWGGSDDDAALAVAVQSTGEIVVAGYSEWLEPDEDFAVLRLTSAGALDASFGFGGWRTIPFDLPGSDKKDRASDVELLPGGEILLAGTADAFTGANSTPEPAFAKLSPAGDPDLSFGSLGGGRCTLALTGTDLDTAEIAVDRRGRLVVAASAGGNLAIGRFDAACLALDPAFGGIVHVVDLGGSETLGGMAIGPDQRIVLAGTSVGSPWAIAAARVWVNDLFADGFESGDPSLWRSSP